MYDMDKPEVSTLNQRAKQVTYREQIEAHLRHHKEQVMKHEAMLKLLDENPAIEKFMDLSRS